MSDSDSDDECGMIQPSLIKQLKAILDQYPDDGQILKELIQNAEDAGASEVTFLYDKHSHGTQTLYHGSLCIHQGPGLVAYNNARFTKEDWTGIRSLYESIKEKDPLKVGRFGLGFKSVFHLTDLPSILSGQQLLILDPHEKILHRTGRPISGKKWNLKKDKTCLTVMRDQFTPYLGLFGCSTKSLKKDDFIGTLFRFPLRKHRSDLSQTIYHDKKIRKLFESFKANAHLILIFLKKVEKIILSEREVSDRTPQKTFEVKIAEDCLETVRKQRANFLKQVVDSKQSCNHQDHISSSYIISIEVLHNEEVTNTYHYLISECYAAGEVSTTFQNLRQELETRYVPMVGIAMQLTDDEAENRSRKPEGQVFCVLPLPREQRSSSGLPVHINGYFSVQQNRRHLKWKTTGQQSESDKDVAWNTCLLSEVLPICYVDLIQKAIRLQKRNRGVSVEDVYAAVPNLSTVDEKWEPFVEMVLSLVLQEQLLFTSANGGQWVSLPDSVLDEPAKDEKAKIVRQVLLSMGYNIVTPPTHVLTVISQYSQPDQVAKVRPQLLRKALRINTKPYEALEDCSKLALLDVILQDLKQRVTELFGIVLLPLADGTFTAFRDQLGSHIYIPSSTQQEILQGLEQYLLRINISPHLLASLRKVAGLGRTCLKEVSPSDMPRLIRAVLPKEWHGRTEVVNQGGHGPSAKWFEKLWSYLVNPVTSLTAFEGLMILPLTTCMPMRMITLKRVPAVILTKYAGTKLSVQLQKFFRELGVFIADAVPKYVLQHSGVLGTYIKPPNAENVLGALLYASEQIGVEKVVSLVASDCRIADDIVSVVDRELSNYTPSSKETDFLKQLPLFPTTMSTPSRQDYASVGKVRHSTTDDQILFSLPSRLLLVQSEKTKTVSDFLGAKLLSRLSVLRKYLIPDIERGAIHPSQIEDVMSYVFERLPSIARKDNSIYDDFSKLLFVKTKSGQLSAPRNLFHPGSALCKSLFSGMNNMFPCGIYAKPEMLALLLKMKLKREPDLWNGDLEQAVVSLRSMSPLTHKAHSIAASILKVLDGNTSFLSGKTPSSESLLKMLESTHWVPAAKTRPSQYPKSLKWRGTRSGICNPSDIVSSKWKYIVGSENAVIDEVAPGLEKAFAWQHFPPLHMVMEHLKNVIESYCSEEKAAYLNVILEVYRYFKTCNLKKLRMSLRECPRWLWVGDQFALPECVVLNNTFLNLHPYVCTLPKELKFLKPILPDLGVRQSIDGSMMINVLHSIKYASEKEDTFAQNEVNLQMVVSILNHVKKDFAGMCESLKAKVLVPVDCEPNETFELQPVEDCTYCDTDWLKEDLDLGHFDSEEKTIKLVHRNLPLETARELGVTPLMNRVLPSQQLEFTAFGPSESLANRIKHLLDDYTDGLAVFKEMIQNADDAGATKVKFLYDARTNDEARMRLLYPNLKDCQGAALWVYNDAVFEDEDFQNVISLGCSNKESAADKIGKFGLGFNVVYNLTDVPSFVTRDSLVIFDPQMSYLCTVHKDKSNPGIILSNQEIRPFLEGCGQFLPYQGVYGCNLSQPYQGTLFRFPLRTAEQANTSNLCRKQYDKSDMVELLKMLENNAHNLLLFTENVAQIKLDFLPDGQKPDELLPMFSVKKRKIKMIQELSFSKGNAESSHGSFGVLHIVAENAEALGDQSRQSVVIETRKTVKYGIKNLEYKTKGVSKHMPENLSWIISTVIQHPRGSSSENQIFQMGGVALQLKADRRDLLPLPLKNGKHRGQVFCGLPLPVYCDLPVHINGNFALHSSRRGFPTGTGDDKHNEKLEWNKGLMADVLPKAYLYALEDVTKVLTNDARVQFYDLWPSSKLCKKVDHVDVTPLIDSFYSRLLATATSPLQHDENGLVTIDAAVFLDRELAPNKEIKTAVLDSLVQVRPDWKPVILPRSVFSQLRESDQGTIAEKKWYDFERYFRKIVFPNLRNLEDNLLEKLVQFALDYPKLYDPMALKLNALECIGVLSSLKDVYGEKALKPTLFQLARDMLRCLGIAIQREQVSPENLRQKVFLPNEMNVLMPLDKMYYTDVPGFGRNPSVVSARVLSSTVRALGVRSWHEFLYESSSIGLPFGQSEDLPNAIKRVLETYPRDLEILKELIQNADDAKATKIHFILDNRHHPFRRVFHDSWKPLQGPALCVFTDIPFTKEDIDGIQAFGTGAKQHDPSKTGQYGIGFNSVYHITDAPSLLTLESGRGSLCVFDPQCRFVPNASAEKPGRKFVGLENLKKEFPDVFKGYLEDLFLLQNATMMRLPLRNRSMAENSAISHKPSPDIRQLFRLLEKEGKDVLIFLNTLKEIEVSEIDAHTAKMRSIYKINAQLCPQLSNGRITPMPDRITEAMKTMDRDVWNIGCIPLSTSVKCLKIADTKGYEEKWLVAESLGTDLETIPQPVEDAIHSEKLRLFPRGAVAAPLSHAIPFEGKAFCSLPMPGTTKLPVHVNGHFALGHENRRHLWTNSDIDGYKKRWNDFLCENVISAAYTELLVALKKVVTDISSGRELLKQQLRDHQSYFPIYRDEEDIWHGLVRACYQRIASLNITIIPKLIEASTAWKQQQQNTRGSRSDLSDLAVVNWTFLHGRGKLKVFFPEAVTITAEGSLVGHWIIEREDSVQLTKRLKEQDVLERCLIRCEFALVEMKEELISSLEKSGVPITRISPGEVLNGFPSRALCKPKALPKSVAKTPFRDERTLITLLEYCSKDEQFVEKLDGLPLLLTADNQLRRFNQKSPAYFTSGWVQKLFPNSAGVFLKKSVFSGVFLGYNQSKLAVIKHFGIEEMSRILPSQLSIPTLCSYSAVKFDKSQDYLKKDNWLNSLWRFIEEELNDLLPKPDVEPLRNLSRADLEHWVEQRNREEKSWLTKCKSIVKQRLKCIEDWCLIPTTKRDIKYLVALKHANMVLGHSHGESERYQVFKLLRRCGVHELSIVNPYDKKVLEILSLLVTTTDNARACLHLLHSALKDQTGVSRLDQRDAKTLLHFFAENIEMLQRDELATSIELAKLPLHKTIYGKLVHLSGYNVVILPENIPTAGIENSEKRTRTLFIEFDQTLEPLYTFLGPEFYNPQRFYCEFLFPQFPMFGKSERNKHLHFLYKKCVVPYRLDDEKNGLLEVMKNTAIITDEDDMLRHASDFCDQTNSIFEAFKPELAPPAAEPPFSCQQWERFLDALGLVREVSPEVFIECAQQVALQGKLLSPSDETAEKSKILMQFIFDEISLNDDNLRVISKIDFVEPSSIPEELRRLCPQQMAAPGYIKLSGSVPQRYSRVVWTQVRLLPEWADPEFTHLQRTEMEHLKTLLGIQKRPSFNLVLEHLCTLAGHLSSTPTECEQSQLKLKVFKNIYKHLEEYRKEEDDTSLNEMQNTACILVEQGTHLVTPSQIVRDLPEQIEPFLYRIPDEMMKFQELFMKLGATEKPTVTPFVMVLKKLYMASQNGRAVMSPNQTRHAFLAVKGLFGVVNQTEGKIPECDLYLPSVEGKLSLSSDLICNDVPSFFKRIHKLSGKQLVNLAECGIESSVALGAVEKLPKQHQPRFVSDEIEEILNEPDSINEGSDVANRLNQRVKSEVFREAVMQLLLHEDYSNNRQPNKEEVNELVNRLEMVKVLAVDRVHTVLRTKRTGQKLTDSSVDKVCHFEKRRQRGFCEWSIFIKDCSALKENLLIPLARVINQILDSKLQTSVLILLPLFTCPENEIVEKLTEFDVDVGALEMTQREPLLPSPGKKLSLTHSEMTKHQTSNIRVKDYVAIKLDQDDALVYAIVKEITNETDRTFLLDTGPSGVQRVTAERIYTL